MAWPTGHSASARSPSGAGWPSLAVKNSFADTLCAVPVAQQIGSARELRRKRARCWQAGCSQEHEGMVAARAVKDWHASVPSLSATRSLQLHRVMDVYGPPLGQVWAPGRERRTGLPSCCLPSAPGQACGPCAGQAALSWGPFHPPVLLTETPFLVVSGWRSPLRSLLCCHNLRVAFLIAFPKVSSHSVIPPPFPSFNFSGHQCYHITFYMCVFLPQPGIFVPFWP